ncbi:MAG: hypothetical protein EOP50_01690 [Sphingobacteriales bacterium]|nr:MAG: hypothetical protein EOP50_01690 [Sphingobacteriales bacterium]
MSGTTKGGADRVFTMKRSNVYLPYFSALLASCIGISNAAAKTIYVSNTSTCTTSCGGTATAAYKDLRTGVAALAAGDTLKIVPTGIPYYYYPDGLPRAGVNQLADSVIDLTALSGKVPATATTITTSDSSQGIPTIRGSLKFGGWISDGQFQNAAGVITYRYHLPWSMVQADNNTIKLQPQQVFRTGANGASDLQLKQIGGTVYGGYPTAVPADMTPEATSVPGAGKLWLGRNPPSFDESNSTSGVSLGSNEFYYDKRVSGAEVLYVQLSSQLAPGEKLEVSVMRYLVKGANLNNVSIDNLNFERSSTSTYARGGALSLNGNKIAVLSLNVYDADSQCIDITGNNNSVDSSNLIRCGQIGIRGWGSGVSVRNNLISKPDSRGFNSHWEAGGMKFIGSGVALTDSTISDNVVRNSEGDGIWLDTHNDRNIIQRNVLAFGKGVAIHVEVSSKEKILDNILIGNQAALQLVDSAGNTVSGNVFVGNAQEAIYGVDDPRTGAGYTVFGSTNASAINSNVMAWNDNDANGNRKPVFIPSTYTLSGNNYCGAAASTDPVLNQGSLHFWMSDQNLVGANMFWFRNWKAYGGVTTRDSNSAMHITAPGYPTDVGSYLAARVMADTYSQLMTRLTGPNGYVTLNCKN